MVFRRLSSLTIILSSLTCAVVQHRQVSPLPERTVWVTAASLMPAWGFYPSSARYDGTRPFGPHAAWSIGSNPHTLTWFVVVPREGRYDVWVRHYAGTGAIRAAIDERAAIATGDVAAVVNRYEWSHLGFQQLSGGAHHIDLRVVNTTIDAVLLTSDPTFDPSSGPLPAPVTSPVIRAPRRYRSDAALTGAAIGGLVIGLLPKYSETIDDWLPDTGSLLSNLSVWGAAGEFKSARLAIRSLGTPRSIVLIGSDLVGSHGRIPASAIDIRVIAVRMRRINLYDTSHAGTPSPELLLKREPIELRPADLDGGFSAAPCAARIPAHEARQFWITVHIPANQSPGRYTGSLLIRGPNALTSTLPFTLDVVPLVLPPVTGRYGVFYSAQPNDPKLPNYVPPDEYRYALQDQADHGANTATLYGSPSTLRIAKAVGLDHTPFLMRWPGVDSSLEREVAARIGFPDLLYYAVDEPRQPDEIQRCRAELLRRASGGIHSVTAVNDKHALEQIGPLLTVPVLSLQVFDHDAVLFALARKVISTPPVSYWLANVSFSLYTRALTGIYSDAAGYQGTIPWAYQDLSSGDLGTDSEVSAFTYRGKSGRPLATLSWEAYRDGINDVRYLQALDRALQSAEAECAGPLRLTCAASGLSRRIATARSLRKRVCDIGRMRWFEYIASIEPGDLGRLRREIADATLAILEILPAPH